MSVNRFSKERGETKRGVYCCKCLRKGKNSEIFKVYGDGTVISYCSRKCQIKWWKQRQIFCEAHKQLKKGI